MLIKIGRAAVVNITGIDYVMIDTTFSPATSRYNSHSAYEIRKYAVVMGYRDMDGEKTTHRLDVGEDLEHAEAIKDEIVSQIREVEMASVSTALENAMMRKNG